jgi:hypothetical protein
LDYFRTRRTWDEKNCGKLSNNDIIFLNEAKDRFGHPGIENLYQKWRAGEVNENAVRTEFAKFRLPAQASIIFATVNGQAALFERYPRAPVNIGGKSAEQASFPGDFTSRVTQEWR